MVSDFHLGAKEDTERENDAFEQAREAIVRALDLGAQLILISGDIFDSRTPSQEVWSEALKLLSVASQRENSGISLVKTIGEKKDEISALPFRGTPIVAIHGNHERRGKGFVNAVEALESAGLLIHIHHNGVVLTSSEEKVAIHGMGYVPDKYASDFLREWSPQPVEDAKNIFMMHQGLGRYTFAAREQSNLDPSDLFGGFDLYISGHVHYKVESEVFGKPLIFPGSTVRTQLLPVEASKPKGFYLVDIQNDSLDYRFVELKSVRDFFYKKKEFEEATTSEVEGWIRENLEKLKETPRQNQAKFPLVRLRLMGTLVKGSSRSEVETKKFEREFEDEFLLSISKEELSSPELEEKTHLLKDIRDEKISMEEKGIQILNSTLKELDYSGELNPEHLFNLLSEEKVDEAYDEVITQVEKHASSILEEKDDYEGEVEELEIS